MPRSAKNLKLEQRIEIAWRFASGECAKDLAQAFGISSRHVRRLAKEEQGEGLAVRDPSETVAFRATRSELEIFDAEWQARGFANRSQALNAVLRGRCGFLDVPRDLVAEFCARWRQARDVSDAGLALAKAVHRGKIVVSPEDRALLIEIVDLAQTMSRDLRGMKDAAQVQRQQEWSKKEEEGAPVLTESKAVSGLDSAAKEAERASLGRGPKAGASSRGAIEGACERTLFERSGSALHHPSLPLGKREARTEVPDSELKNRNTLSAFRLEPESSITASRLASNAIAEERNYKASRNAVDG